MNKNINIPGRLHSVATDGQVAGANEIYDDEQQKFQGEINAELHEEMEDAKEVVSSFDDRVKAIEDLAEISIEGGEVQVANTAEEIVAGSGKVPTANALNERLTSSDYVDDEPVAGSDKLVKSDGVGRVLNSIDNKIGNWHGSVEIENAAFSDAIDVNIKQAEVFDIKINVNNTISRLAVFANTKGSSDRIVNLTSIEQTTSITTQVIAPNNISKIYIYIETNSESIDIAYSIILCLTKDLKDVSDQCLAGIKPIYDGKLKWYESNYYNLSDGLKRYHSSYVCTDKVHSFMYQLFNNSINTSLEDSYSVISFWLDNIYKGYRIQDTFYNPDGTVVENINYDTFSVSLRKDRFPNHEDIFKMYDISNASDLNNIIYPLIYGQLKWNDGYYNLTTGIYVAGGNYVSTTIYPSNYYNLIDTDAKNYILSDRHSLVSLWENSVYVGYIIQGIYHKPDGTVVENINYDEFALNIRPKDFVGYDYQSKVVLVLVNNINNKIRFDRDFFALGDSTTYGYGSTGNNMSWADILSNLAIFSSYTKLAVNSTFCMYHEEKPRLSSQISAVPSNYTGIITIMIGTNDFFFDSPIGDASSALSVDYSTLNDEVNFAESFRYNLETLKRKAPNAIILCMMPLPSYDVNDTHHHLDESNLFAIRDIERTICNAMGIPIIESQYEFGLTRYMNDWNFFFHDYCHPNDNGYERIAHCMLGKFIEYCQ